MSIRPDICLLSDLGARSDIEAFPAPSGVSEPPPSVAHLLCVLAQPLAPTHPHHALFNTSLHSMRQTSAVTLFLPGGTLRQREEAF